MRRFLTFFEETMSCSCVSRFIKRRRKNGRTSLSYLPFPTAFVDRLRTYGIRPLRDKGTVHDRVRITQPKFIDWSKKPVRIPALLPSPGLPDPTSSSHDSTEKIHRSGDATGNRPRCNCYSARRNDGAGAYRHFCRARLLHIFIQIFDPRKHSSRDAQTALHLTGNSGRASGRPERLPARRASRPNAVSLFSALTRQQSNSQNPKSANEKTSGSEVFSRIT